MEHKTWVPLSTPKNRPKLYFLMLYNVYITGNYWYRSITRMSKLTKNSLEGSGSYSGTSGAITKIKKKYYKY